MAKLTLKPRSFGGCNDVLIPESVLPVNTLAENVVLYLCLDIFDLNEEMPSGSGTTPAKHRIIELVDFQQCGMSDQQSLRSACAYAQADQSLCFYTDGL